MWLKNVRSVTYRIHNVCLYWERQCRFEQKGGRFFHRGLPQQIHLGEPTTSLKTVFPNSRHKISRKAQTDNITIISTLNTIILSRRPFSSEMYRGYLWTTHVYATNKNQVFMCEQSVLRMANKKLAMCSKK